MQSVVWLLQSSMCCASVLTHHLGAACSEIFLLRIGLLWTLLRGETKAHSWYWRTSVCFAVFLLSRCWSLWNWRQPNLKHFNYTSLPFGLLSFLPNNAGPISFAVERGISVHFEICIRWACIITACTSLNVLSQKLDCLNVGFELKPSSHNDTSIASQGKQTAVSYPLYASNQCLTGNDPPFLLCYEHQL